MADGKLSLGNLAATIHNLNMTGTIGASATIDTYAPAASVGLYQLITSMITDLVSIKNKVKANEKIIESGLKTAAIAHQGSDSASVNFLHTATITGAVDGSGSDIIIANEESSIASNARGALVALAAANSNGSGINKPSVLSGGGGRFYSEDGLFCVLRNCGVLLHDLNLATSDVSAISTAANNTVNGITAATSH